MYNQLIQDFIQINNNLCESKKLWNCSENGVLIARYPFLNSFDEAVLTMYDLRDENSPFCKSVIKEERYSTKEEAFVALQQILDILIKIQENEVFTAIFNARAKGCGISFASFLENDLNCFTKAYKKWIG